MKRVPVVSPFVKRHVQCLGALICCGLLAMGVAACAKKGGPPPSHPVVVQSALAVKTNVPIVITVFGSTTERASVDVVPQVSGTLIKTRIQDGDVVTNGQVLFEIDSRDYETRVRQAEGALAADTANLTLNRLTLERNRMLLKDKLIAEVDFAALQARVDAGIAQVKADEAALDEAKLNLSRCAISAPLDGVCSKRYLDNGNLATAGMSKLVNIRSYDPLYVDFTVSETYLALIREAMTHPPVRITITPRGDTNSYEGTVASMDNAVNQQTGTLALRGVVPNPNLKLWANQFVDVHVYAGMMRDAIMVPEGAVQYGKLGTYLFGVTPTNTATLHLVKTGVRHEDRIQIMSDVEAGERVVVLGQLILYPGAQVMDMSQVPLQETHAPVAKPSETNVKK